MKRIIFLFLFFPITLLTQSETAILSYNVSAVLNEQLNQMTGNAFIQLKMQSVPASYSFLVPRSWKITSIRDGNNEPYDGASSVSGKIHFYNFTIDLVNRNFSDASLLLNIEFSASYDTTSFSRMFVNRNSFLLPCNDSISWLPDFGLTTVERHSLEITAPSQFSVFTSRPISSVQADGVLQWKRSDTVNSKISDAFTLCGLNYPERHISFNPDSSSSVTIVAARGLFHPQYAEAVSRQMMDAGKFFSSITRKHQKQDLTYAIVGDGTNDQDEYSTKDFFIKRNSPSSFVFDSSSISRLAHNHWLTSLARKYCPVTDESTAVFDDGLAAYLSMRFLAETYPATERQERFDAISNALTFFPTADLAAGHTSRLNTNRIISNKGRFLFHMLEYLLSRERFDIVLGELMDRFSDRPVTFIDFQNICEKEYGTPLGWFFNQWLYRPSAPEYVLQWRHEKTTRGMTIVKATIEQRGDLFKMPLPLVFSFGNRSFTKRVIVDKPRQEFSFVFPTVPLSVECDPHYMILRWLLDIRISAHAKTALQYLTVNNDMENAEREALYTQLLDPNNSTGSAPLIHFVLGSIRMLQNNMDEAKESFLRSSSAESAPETEPYTLLSLFRYANIIDSEGKRDEAVSIYQRIIFEGKRKPVIFEKPVIAAMRALLFPSRDNKGEWFKIAE